MDTSLGKKSELVAHVICSLLSFQQHQRHCTFFHYIALASTQGVNSRVTTQAVYKKGNEKNTDGERDWVWKKGKLPVNQRSSSVILSTKDQLLIFEWRPNLTNILFLSIKTFHVFNHFLISLVSIIRQSCRLHNRQDARKKWYEVSLDIVSGKNFSFYSFIP